MAKQTMGVGFFNKRFRADTKSYQLSYPQKAIVGFKAGEESKVGFDQYPSGTNAIVAVVSYTGYDIQDAMIGNKAAYERGFAHGTMYKAS